MEKDNCVVCDKYLKEIEEQETLMCDDCDKSTAKIAKDIETIEDNICYEPKIIEI